jgi:tryptophanyl-tRNA synthetase
LTDNKDLIISKIKKAKTDPLPIPSDIEELNKRPEARNLLGIYSSLMETSLEKTIQIFEKKNFSEFKDQLSQVLVEKIEPISVEIKKLINDKKYLDKVLFDGCQKANNIASIKVKKLQELVGF